MEWVKEFYKKQFLALVSTINTIPSKFFEEEIQNISEQIGRTYCHVLELGAGSGKIANELAKQGKFVTTVELVKELTDYAKQDAHPNLNILCGDFYKVNLDEQFEAILYLDGFGIGTDDDQLQLLNRIKHWLTDDGCALIDIYNPEYWNKIHSTQMSPTNNPTLLRKYSYDDLHQRMIDTWWHVENENDPYTQSLACYTLDEIYMLCQKANLQIIAYYPGGAMDFKNGVYHDITTLDNCLSYRIKLERKNNLFKPRL